LHEAVAICLKAAKGELKAAEAAKPLSRETMWRQRASFPPNPKLEPEAVVPTVGR
jgi:hypothetical protein